MRARGGSVGAVVLFLIFGVCSPKMFVLLLPRREKPGRVSRGHKTVSVGCGQLVAHARDVPSFALAGGAGFIAPTEVPSSFLVVKKPKNITQFFFTAEALCSLVECELAWGECCL